MVLAHLYHQLTPSILDAARERGVPAVMTLHDYKLVCPRYDLLRHGRPCDACVEQGPAACLRHRCAGGSWARSAWLAAESTFQRARGSYDAVRLFLAPSRFLEGVLVRGGYDPNRLRHVPNFVPAPAADGGAGDPQRVVYAGRLSPEKGVETLLLAFARLGRGRLVVCGDGPLRHRVQALAAATKPGTIELRGHLDRPSLEAEIAAPVSAPCRLGMARERTVAASNRWRAAAPSCLASGGCPRSCVMEKPVAAATGDVGAWASALGRAFDAPETIRASASGAVTKPTRAGRWMRT